MEPEERTSCATSSLVMMSLGNFLRNVRTARANRSLRSSGSIGANYIEAQEALSKKDFGMRVKICRKEAKESSYWLKLLGDVPDSLQHGHSHLLRESYELTKIFSATVEKVRT